jgi:drug/metabolite transporter (DMT)-like permease
VALLLSTPPLFVLPLRRLQGDAPTRLEIIGVILSVTGIALILAPRPTVMEGFAKAHCFGDALAICAAAMTALYAFTYRQLAIHDIAPEPTSLTFLTFLLGTAVLIGIVWLFSITVSLGNFSGSSLFSFLGRRTLHRNSELRVCHRIETATFNSNSGNLAPYSFVRWYLRLRFPG